MTSTLRTRLLATADRVRNIRLPGQLDQAPFIVNIVTRTWAGSEVGADGGFTDSRLTLPQKFPVRQMTTSEVGSSGGRYELGDILVRHITPANAANPGIGFTPAQLAPSPTAAGVEIIYILSGGQHDGEYSRRELRSYRNYSYELVLRRRVTTPSVT